VGIELHTSYIIIGGSSLDAKELILIYILRFNLLILLKLQDIILIIYVFSYHRSRVQGPVYIITFIIIQS
jgi:hypothetical protein